MREIQVLHAVPGRVRIRLTRLKHNTTYAKEIQEDLSKVPGIQGVEAHSLTGSLLIKYDPNILEVLLLHSSVLSSLGRSTPNKHEKFEEKLPEARGRNQPAPNKQKSTKPKKITSRVPEDPVPHKKMKR